MGVIADVSLRFKFGGVEPGGTRNEKSQSGSQSERELEKFSRQ